MVKRFSLQRFDSTFFERGAVQILFLVIIAIIAHGLFTPWLGFYGDDWGFLWLSYQAETPELLITKSRFFLPELYALLSKLLPPHPLAWHLFHLSMFILSVINNWILQKML